MPYTFPNIKATAHWLAETPFKPSWIRTPGRMQNTYANESFIDEFAAAAGADPVEFRLRNLKDARGAECIDRCAQMAKWEPRGKPRSATDGDIARGRGFSYVKYELVRTYVAVVADVAVNRRTGQVKVDRFYVAHDCGQIINPDGLRNQIDGNVDPDGEPHADRGARLEPLDGDRARLGELSDPALSRRAAHRHRPHRPAERAAVGRGRADGGGGALRDRQRGLRRDGRADALGAVHAGQGAGGAENGMSRRSAGKNAGRRGPPRFFAPSNPCHKRGVVWRFMQTGAAPC